MRVLLVSRCTWTLANFRAGLVRHLRSGGSEVHAAGNDADGYRGQVEESGAVFHSLPVAKRSLNPLRDLYLVYCSARLCRRIRPDVAHFFTIKPVIFGVLGARLARVPKIVCTITGLGYAFTSSSSLLNCLASSLYRFSLSHANVVFFQNSDDRDLFVEKGLIDPDIARLVPGSGVDTGFFAPESRRNRDSTEREVVRFGFIGRLLGDKGIREFLEAVPLVRATNPEAEFHVVGDFDSANPTCIAEWEIARIVESGDLIWHGHVDDVRGFLTTLDVVVLPSYREGTPRVLLEAAAMGIPLIATDVPGCRDVVVDEVTGLLVPAKDVPGLVAAIVRLFENRGERVRMGNAGRQKILNEYDERIVFKLTEEAYRSERNDGVNA